MVLHVIKTSFILLVCFNLFGRCDARHNILVYMQKTPNIILFKQGGETNMTQNTIAYANYLENKRSNLANEVETERSNKAREEYNLMNLTEITRSNKADEALKSESNKETKRSNVAREKETKRSNVAQEKIKKATNKETKRANRANEQIKRDANRIQKVLGNKQITETIRSNKANERIKRIANQLTKIRDTDTRNNNAARIQLEYDRLKQEVSENAKDRTNKELVAYINKLGEELATAGFVAMKGNQYKDQIGEVAQDLITKSKPARDLSSKGYKKLNSDKNEVIKAAKKTVSKAKSGATRVKEMAKKVTGKSKVKFATLK